MSVRVLRPARRRARSDGGEGPAPALAAEAVSRFLDALGLPPEVRAGADLVETPRRVVEAWLGDLVDGYGRDPAAILSGPIPSASADLVAVTGIDFHSICPHHLLPSHGLAHVAYLPGGRLVGFGQIVQLVDALAHRLVLQEELAREIAEALVEHLGARGAACVLDMEQLCMTVRAGKRTRSRVRTQAFAGALQRDGSARRSFLAMVASPHRSARPSAAAPGSGRARPSAARRRSRSEARSRSRRP